MIMNALNGVKSDYYPERITKADKDFFKKFDLKDLKFSVKVKHIHKIDKKTNSNSISVFGYENKEKHPIYVSKNVVKKKMLIYYQEKKKERDTMFLSKILIH